MQQAGKGSNEYKLSFISYRQQSVIGSPFTHTILPLSPAFAAAVKPLPVVKAQHALHLRALVDMEADESGTRRRQGDEWQLAGPTTYLPCADVVSHDIPITCLSHVTSHMTLIMTII